MTAYPPEWQQAIEQFRDREYYACHDTLEALWIDAIEPDKKFYQGVLQIAVACYHLGTHNRQGALVLLGEGMGRLRHYSPAYAGINVEKLIAASYHLLQQLQAIEPSQIQSFVVNLDPQVLPNIERL